MRLYSILRLRLNCSDGSQGGAADSNALNGAILDDLNDLYNDRSSTTRALHDFQRIVRLQATRVLLY